MNSYQNPVSHYSCRGACTRRAARRTRKFAAKSASDSDEPLHVVVTVNVSIEFSSTQHAPHPTVLLEQHRRAFTPGHEILAQGLPEPNL